MVIDPGPTAVQAAHTNLRKLLVRLEGLEDLHAEGDLLDTLVPLLKEHFDEEEAKDGLYAQILADQPNREGVLHALQADHVRLLRDADLLTQELRALELAVVRVHTHKAALLRALRRHEAAENKLMFESVNLDIGVGD